MRESKPGPSDATVTEADRAIVTFAGDIPVGFLRALAQHESSFDPHIANPAGAYGLFQITKPVLVDFNAHNGTNHTTADLVQSAALNTQIAVDHLDRILALYTRHPALQTDWTSRRFVELLVFGWNVGHNAVAGLVGRLERAGVPSAAITVDSLSQVAARFTHNQLLSSARHVAFAKAVAATFLGAPDQTPGPRVAARAAAASLLLGMGLLGLGLAVAPRRKSP